MDAIIKFFADLHLFHTWGKWEKKDYASQERHCTICSKTQRQHLGHIHLWSKWEYHDCSMIKRNHGVGEDEHYLQPYQERKCSICGVVEQGKLNY